MMSGGMKGETLMSYLEYCIGADSFDLLDFHQRNQITERLIHPH